jgi:hypothetical protein
MKKIAMKGAIKDLRRSLSIFFTYLSPGMNKETKIIVSAEELHVLQDKEFFRKKKNITEKIYNQFALLIRQLEYENIFLDISFPTATDVSTGKISKGENYLGFPFVLLDFPRLFSNDEIIAIRTMVWWGNFISCTLLVTGSRLALCRKAVIQNYLKLASVNTWICVNDSPWHHHFNADNYKLMLHLNKFEVELLLSKNLFLKLSRKIPVGEINDLVPFSIESITMYALLFRN